MSDTITDFYDRLSLEYRHNMGWDWETAVRKEGASLDSFITNQLGCQGPYSLLDCSCGIGTQAIGLALQGHQVHATDLSPVSIERAEQESVKLGVAMTFGVADFRTLGSTITDTFDVVISCDNSFAHCLNDEDLDAALASIKTRLNPGGLLLLSIRDYNTLVADKPCFNSEHVQGELDVRRVAFQVWDWASDDRRYHVDQFLIKKVEGKYKLKHFETELRALLREDVTAAVHRAGYSEVSWHFPETSGYYQPIVTARS